jgi:hypothetical protein
MVVRQEIIGGHSTRFLVCLTQNHQLQKDYRSLSKKEQDIVNAFRKEKIKKKKDGSSIGAVVVESAAVLPVPKNGCYQYLRTGWPRRPTPLLIFIRLSKSVLMLVILGCLS